MELQATDESGSVHDETDAAFRFCFVEKCLQGSRVIGSPAGNNVAVENCVFACIIGVHDGPLILLFSSFSDFDGIDEQFINGVIGAKHQTITASGEHVEIH